jgi:hypothetical protein
MDDLRALVAQSVRTTEAFKLSTEAFKEQIAASQEAADRRAAEADKTMEALKRQIKELGQQIGGLGNKFGSFTEGLALPSVEKLLFDTFQIDLFQTRIRKRLPTGRIEIDGLGIAEERKLAYVVEVKSHLDMRAIEQVLTIMQNIRTYFPYHAEKTFYAMIAAADVHDDAYKAAVKEGIYVVGFADELMMFSMPEGFVPKAF